jgi:hypothetical protein
MDAEFNNDSHHCSFPWEEGSGFSGCSLSASHALLRDLHANQERKQNLVPKGPVPHTRDSASCLCNGTGENNEDLVEIAENDTRQADLVEITVQWYSSACLVKLCGYMWVRGLRSLVVTCSQSFLNSWLHLHLMHFHFSLDRSCSGRKSCGFYVSNALLHWPISSLHGGDVLVGSTYLHHAVVVAGPLSSGAQSFGLSAILFCCFASGRGLLPLIDWRELKSDERGACVFCAVKGLLHDPWELANASRLVLYGSRTFLDRSWLVNCRFYLPRWVEAAAFFISIPVSMCFNTMLTTLAGITKQWLSQACKRKFPISATSLICKSASMHNKEFNLS